VAIPGATKPAQAEESTAAMTVKLGEKERARIDELSRHSNMEFPAKAGYH
jgi:aryl-alcohol dehydrogenase-like predicted oxidoreductase